MVNAETIFYEIKLASYRPDPTKNHFVWGRLVLSDSAIAFTEKMMFFQRIELLLMLLSFFVAMYSLYPKMVGLYLFLAVIFVAVWVWRFQLAQRRSSSTKSSESCDREIPLRQITQFSRISYGLNRNILQVMTKDGQEYQFSVAPKIFPLVDALIAVLARQNRYVEKRNEGKFPEWIVVDRKV